MPERSYRALLWTLALTGLLLDQGTKYGVFHWLSGGEGSSFTVFGAEESGFRIIAQFEPDGAGNWRPHVNHGALFGFLRHWEGAANGGFATVSLLAALAIAFWSTQQATARDPWLCAALGLILAGTLGNFYDRVVYHGVRDFLHWNLFFDWPVFNIADCCLVTGACLLLLQAFSATPEHETRETPKLRRLDEQPATHTPTETVAATAGAK